MRLRQNPCSHYKNNSDLRILHGRYSVFSWLNTGLSNLFAIAGLSRNP